MLQFAIEPSQHFGRPHTMSIPTTRLPPMQSVPPPPASVSLSDEDMLESDEWSDSLGDAKTGDQPQRSRRLLSLEQSKVLYKILEKTHFPSTQLREAAAQELGVSARKVQVWFQNRRQVGKKRMIEAVQARAVYGPVSLEEMHAQMRATGKGRFGWDGEDERTRAWRRHTIRIALNPTSKTSPREQARSALRIDVPRAEYAAPTYTGLGSATHLDTLSRGMERLTPALVSSQKESFSIRSRSQTLSTHEAAREDIRQVRGSLTAEWHANQRSLARSYERNDRSVRPVHSPPPLSPSPRWREYAHPYSYAYGRSRSSSEAYYAYPPPPPPVQRAQTPTTADTLVAESQCKLTPPKRLSPMDVRSLTSA
ncbi:transcription factor [Moesziomyces antarcticus T-34]|uniref:Transcription factor n=1 Tax=Pseudozyma antarctica (strain T-34) TaxID=1151754 RepID=M9MIT8_PSEA3|nr:transcription factor [Moesziomyces antarcticus T-34]